MIGQNDTASRALRPRRCQSAAAFAQGHRLRRLSMWSVNRDQSCGPNYANVEVVSDNCSGVESGAGAFTTVFAPFTAGAAALRAAPRLDSRHAVRAPRSSRRSGHLAVRDLELRPRLPGAPRSSGITTCTRPSGGRRAIRRTHRSRPADTPWTLSARCCPASTRQPTPTVAGHFPDLVGDRLRTAPATRGTARPPTPAAQAGRRRRAADARPAPLWARRSRTGVRRTPSQMSTMWRRCRCRRRSPRWRESR